mmetsp:Transcript_27244/g.76096  ORF Transcript_27244/g.76096 Transcript_27244/m.76096 type:complete len:659 (+) Transcript_27244:89-2065(+)
MEDEMEKKWAELRARSIANEQRCGVEEFIGSHLGMSGRIKARYSDFLVNEIDADGKVVHLTCTQDPSIHEEKAKEEAVSSKGNSEVFPAEAEEILKKYISAESLSDFVTFITQTPAANRRHAAFAFPKLDVKEARAEVHRAVRLIGGVKSVTYSKDAKKGGLQNVQMTSGMKRKRVDDEGKEGEVDVPHISSLHEHDGCIIVQFGADKQPRGAWKRRKKGDSEKTKFQTEFSLFKENKDTTEVVSLLARLSHGKNKAFSYAGTKDKRGITVQRMRVDGLDASSLYRLNSRLRGIRVGDCVAKEGPLRLGDHSGNRFTVVVRGVSETDTDIVKSVESVSKDGFLNYFGMQRFGSPSVPTWSIGQAMLKEDWEEAFNLIMMEREEEHVTHKAARKVWAETRNASKTLNALPSSMYLERRLLLSFKHASGHPHHAAIMSLDRNNRLLYVHALQSLVWNKVVSRRVRKYGHTVVVGDLVRCNVPTERDLEILRNSVQNEKAREYVCKRNAVHVVTAEDVDRGVYKREDILLPLPGTGVLLPQNDIGQAFEEVLQELGLNDSNFATRNVDYQLFGDYRLVYCRPSDVSHDILYYKRDEEQLVPHDMDRLHGVEIPVDIVRAGDPGAKKAVALSFSLPNSTYATMLLREVTKKSSQELCHRFFK